MLYTRGMKNNFKLYRLQRKISVVDMSEKLNVTRQTYTNYEKGTFEPTLETLVKISNILSVSIDDLLGNQNFITSELSSKQSLISELEELIQKYK